MVCQHRHISYTAAIGAAVTFFFFVVKILPSWKRHHQQFHFIFKLVSYGLKSIFVPVRRRRIAKKEKQQTEEKKEKNRCRLRNVIRPRGISLCICMCGMYSAWLMVCTGRRDGSGQDPPVYCPCLASSGPGCKWSCSSHGAPKCALAMWVYSNIDMAMAG